MAIYLPTKNTQVAAAWVQSPCKVLFEMARRAPGENIDMEFGGKLFHIMSGNLSHQIEHHLFPDIPARRYADMAPVVRDICQRYGQHYNTGRLSVQFGQVVWRILRHAFPSRPPKRTQAALVEQAA